ncbi:hypothetical protein F2Q69_00042427 [Brassica cretica]|uniref:Uncharacterized protein n=1 Tax=Brassica cretica TaxID=69181 RepID=A0A8S9NEX4_BRACR|nr:hypothetical protein F2Q69_00042427 [Brassica cretica]
MASKSIVVFLFLAVIASSVIAQAPGPSPTRSPLPATPPISQPPRTAAQLHHAPALRRPPSLPRQLPPPLRLVHPPPPSLHRRLLRHLLPPMERLPQMLLHARPNLLLLTRITRLHSPPGLLRDLYSSLLCYCSMVF